jgi:Uma2 family endonuclease
MNVALKKAMTAAQFLAWEERQELRFEFDGVRPVAMTGGTYNHDRITTNLAAALVSRLRGKPCRASGPNMKIEAAGRFRYPDAFVVCTPVPPGATVVRDPVIVFEVLSEGTTNTDLIEKNREYRATPSIQRYVILEQSHAAAMAFVRKGEDWIAEIAAGHDARLLLPEIGIAIPLAELYQDVELSGSEPSEIGA